MQKTIFSKSSVSLCLRIVLCIVSGFKNRNHKETFDFIVINLALKHETFSVGTMKKTTSYILHILRSMCLAKLPKMPIQIFYKLIVWGIGLFKNILMWCICSSVPFLIGAVVISTRY